MRLIRLSYDEMQELQRQIQSTGQVNATVVPESLYQQFKDKNVFIAWSRNMSREEFFLMVWRNADEWNRAFMEERDNSLVRVFEDEGKRQRDLENLPNDFRKKLEQRGLLPFATGESEEPVVHFIKLDSQGNPYGIGSGGSVDPLYRPYRQSD